MDLIENARILHLLVLRERKDLGDHLCGLLWIIR